MFSGYESDIYLSPKLMLMSPPNALIPCAREVADRRFALDSDEEMMLGSGASGCSVVRIYDRETEQHVAAKVMCNNPGALWEIKMFERAFARLENKRVLPELYGACEIRGGSHVALLMQQLEPLEPNECGASGKYARGMRRCLDALHSAGIAHGDVHVKNFMWDPESVCREDDGVRIIDFGLSFDYLSAEAAMLGSLPDAPRGKRHPELSFAFLARNGNSRMRDYRVDDIKLEAAIDMLAA